MKIIPTPAAEANVVTLAESDVARRARVGLTEAAELLYNHGAQLKVSGNSAAAVIAFRRAIGFQPNAGMIWNALGSALWDMGDYEAAFHAFTRAQGLGYHDSTLYGNMGLLMASCRRWDEAERFFSKSIERDPANLHSKWNLAHCFLDQGDWERGLEAYEVRKAYRGTRLYPLMPYPQWEGESLRGKTLYIQGEQGAGDRILLSRYVAWIKRRWPTCKVIFSPSDELLALLSGFQNDGLCQLQVDNTPWPKADYGVFLASLPRLHGTRPDRVPPDPGLIRREAQKLRFRAPPPRFPALKVGVAWTGNPDMQRNAERTLPFLRILELEDNPQVQLYSLQFGSGQTDIQRYGAKGLITDLVPLIHPRGFLGTAAAMLDLDLIITCCTSVAHLAGALNIPTWVLLCSDPYWVWLHDRDYSPWYPSVKLYRQERAGDWDPVFDKVKVALADRAADHLEPQPRYKRRKSKPASGDAGSPK